MNRLIYLVLISLLISLSLPSFAKALAAPLPAQNAFIFNSTVNRHNEILLNWQMPPGYYLYRERMQVETEPQSAMVPMTLPQGELKYVTEADGKYRRFEIYENAITIPLILKSAAPSVNITVKYQGCSQDGFCYPPTQKKMTFDTGSQTLQQSAEYESVKLSSLLTSQHEVRSLFDTSHFAVRFFLFLGLGLLLAFTPCVLPMIPILTSIIVGQKKVSGKKALLLSLTYVLGMSLTYALAGVLAAMLGSSLHVWLQQTWIIAMMSALFVLLSLSLFGLFELRLPNRLQQPLAALNHKLHGGTYLGVALMGVFSTLIVSPCVTAPLVGVLLYISESGNIWVGASALFAIGLGMGLPLLIIGTTAGNWLPKSGPWMELVKKFFGALMLGMAVWLLSRVYSPIAILLIVGASACFAAIFFVISKISTFYRRLGYGLAVFGLALIIGSVVAPHYLVNSAPDSSFIIVKNLKNFDRQLTLAQAAQQPVILDFYASWCDSCVAMDKLVFAKSDVKNQLSRYVLLRADLSANSAEDEALLKHFKVIAPPTILFFNASGQEIVSQRIVGEMNASEFIAHLGKVSEGMEITR